MAGLKSVTGNYIVGKKIDSFYESKDGKEPIPKRQLILLSEDGAFQVTCTEEVLKQVEEYKQYSFVVDNDVANRKTKLVGVLFEDKKNGKE